MRAGWIYARSVFTFYKALMERGEPGMLVNVFFLRAILSRNHLTEPNSTGNEQ